MFFAAISQRFLVYNPSCVMNATSNQGFLKMHWMCLHWSGRMARSLEKKTPPSVSTRWRFRTAKA